MKIMFCLQVLILLAYSYHCSFPQTSESPVERKLSSLSCNKVLS